jgi:hypothetical protein
MTRDHMEERMNIDLSRSQRQAWEKILLEAAGLSKEEAGHIASLAALDRILADVAGEPEAMERAA